MAGDVRDTDRYRRVEALVRSILEPGFGRPHAFDAAEASPDGRFVAVTGRVFERLEGHPASLLWIATADGQRTWTVTTAAGDAADPRWSPDGRSLSFLADHHDRHRHAPWVVDVGRTGRRASRAGSRARRASPSTIAGPRTGAGSCSSWPASRPSRQTASGPARSGRTLPPPTGRRGSRRSRRPRARTNGGRRGPWTRPPGEVRRVSPEGLNVWEAAWLGDDRVVAIVSDGPAEDAWYGARVVALDAATGAVTELWTPEWQLGLRGGGAGRPSGRRHRGRRERPLLRRGGAGHPRRGRRGRHRRHPRRGRLERPLAGRRTAPGPGRVRDGDRGARHRPASGRGPRDLPDAGGRRLPGPDGLARGHRRRLRDAPGRPGGAGSRRRRPRGP